MMTELEKIDAIRERTGIGYAQAQALLQEARGDIVQAFVLHEQYEKERAPQTRLVNAIKRLLRQGNVTNIRIRKGEQVYLEIPVTAGVISVAMVPNLLLLAGVTCIVGRCTVEFQRKDDGKQDEWHAVSSPEFGS